MLCSMNVSYYMIVVNWWWRYAFYEFLWRLAYDRNGYYYGEECSSLYFYMWGFQFSYGANREEQKYNEEWILLSLKELSYSNFSISSVPHIERVEVSLRELKADNVAVHVTKLYWTSDHAIYAFNICIYILNLASHIFHEIYFKVLEKIKWEASFFPALPNGLFNERPD